MRAVGEFLFRIVFGVALLALLPAAAAVLWRLLVAPPESFLWWPVLGGIAAGVAAYHLLLRRLPWLEVFEHELTHALVAWLFWRRVTHFTVRRNDGHVQYTRGFGGVFGDDLIAFAPYIIPTITAVLILLRPVFGPSAPWYDVWVGVSFGYHLGSGWREIHPGQPDLYGRGLLYSLVAVPALGLLIHGLLLAILLHGYPGVPAWAVAVWEGTISLIR